MDNQLAAIVHVEGDFCDLKPENPIVDSPKIGA